MAIIFRPLHHFSPCLRLSGMVLSSPKAISDSPGIFPCRVREAFPSAHPSKNNRVSIPGLLGGIRWPWPRRTSQPVAGTRALGGCSPEFLSTPLQHGCVAARLCPLAGDGEFMPCCPRRSWLARPLRAGDAEEVRIAWDSSGLPVARQSPAFYCQEGVIPGWWVCLALGLPCRPAGHPSLAGF